MMKVDIIHIYMRVIFRDVLGRSGYPKASSAFADCCECTHRSPDTSRIFQLQFRCLKVSFHFVQHVFYCRLDIHVLSQVFVGGQDLGGGGVTQQHVAMYQGGGSGIMPLVMMQQDIGSWQSPLTSFPTSIIVPSGNINQLTEISELRKRLDEEMKLKKDLCTQNSKEIIGLRGECKVMKQKNKLLEEDLEAEKKKRHERDTSLDKVREEKWYAVNEVKEKLRELEREQQERRLAEKTLEEIKVEFVKEREKRKAAEKRVRELESEKGGKGTAGPTLDFRNLEKEERLKKAHQKKEEYQMKEKEREKRKAAEKGVNEVGDGKAIEVALEKGFREEWEDDHFEWAGRGVGMMISKPRRNESCGSREQESSQKSEYIARGKGEENWCKAVEDDYDELKESDVVAKNTEELVKMKKIEVKHRQIQCPRCTRKVRKKTIIQLYLKMYLTFTCTSEVFTISRFQ